MSETVTIPFKLTLNPTTKQEETFRGVIGAVRFAYNATLAHVLENWELNKTLTKEEQSYISTHPYELAKWMVSVKDDIAPWNREYSKYVFQAGAENAGNAFQNFLKARNGSRAGKSGLPKYKSRKNQNQAGCLFANLKLDGNKVFIPKLGWVRFYETDKTILWLLSQGARITQGTLKCQHARWTMSVNIKMSNELALKYYEGKYKIAQRKVKAANKSVGGDVGLKTFLTLSDGTVFENPKTYAKQVGKLRRLNKQLARRSRANSKIENINFETGEITSVWSNRHNKAVKAVQKQHAKVYNQRNNFLHNTSKQIIMDYDTIGLENLNIAGMVKNKHLSKSISDAAWGEFIRQVDYKLKRVGGILVKTGRFEPSSKTCSECGTVKTKLLLSERTFSCEACGISLDRDLNAAINIHKLAIKEVNNQLNLQAAGSIKARGAGSTGSLVAIPESETTLLGSEKRDKALDSSRKTHKSSKSGSAKITTLLA